MPLLKFFAKIVLDSNLPEENAGTRNNIEQIKYSDFSFVFDFDSGIESVKCREMTVGVIGRPGKDVRIRVPENGPADEIAKFLTNDLNDEQLPLELLTVKNVCIQVKMKNDSSGYGICLYITPMNDPLRKLSEGKRFLCERLLKDSRAQSAAVNTSEKPAHFIRKTANTLFIVRTAAGHRSKPGNWSNGDWITMCLYGLRQRKSGATPSGRKSGDIFGISAFLPQDSAGPCG